jgi:hypothetical protein
MLGIAHAAASKSKQVARDAASENAVAMLERVLSEENFVEPGRAVI